MHVVQFEQLLVLAHQGVPGLGQDAHQVGLVQIVHMGDDGDAAHEFGDQAELHQVLGLDLFQQLAQGHLLLGADLSAEAHGAAAHAGAHDLVQAHEGTAHDEQDIAGIHADEFLLGMLAAALGRDVGLGAFDDLEQGLLHAFTGHVTGDGGAVALAGDLVDLVDVDDALAGGFDVVVGILQQLHQDVLHILAHVTGFGQGRGVGDGKGHAQHLGQGLGQQGLAAAGGPHQQDVALFQLHVVAQGVGEEDALVVVVHGHGKDLLGLCLADDVFIQAGLDLLRREQALVGLLHLLLDLVTGDDVAAGAHAVVADAGVVLHDKVVHLQLAASAEGAAQRFLS